MAYILPSGVIFDGNLSFRNHIANMQVLSLAIVNQTDAGGTGQCKFDFFNSLFHNNPVKKFTELRVENRLAGVVGYLRPRDLVVGGFQSNVTLFLK